MKVLAQLEVRTDWSATLQCAEGLLDTSPLSRVLHVAKAKALCRLKRWAEAKEFIEEVVEVTHVTIQTLHAHPRTSVPAPPSSTLKFTSRPSTSSKGVELHVDCDALVRFILAIGPELGNVYLCTWKMVLITEGQCH